MFIRWSNVFRAHFVCLYVKVDNKQILMHECDTGTKTVYLFHGYSYHGHT